MNNVSIRKVIKKKDRVNPVQDYFSNEPWRTEKEKQADPDSKKSMVLTQAKAFIQGSTYKELENDLGLSYVAQAKGLRDKFLDTAEGSALLKSLLLNNAISSGSVFMNRLEELTAPQAAGAAQIFTNSFINLDRHSKSEEIPVDWKALAELGQSLQGLSELAQL